MEGGGGLLGRGFFFLFIHNTSQVPGSIEIGMARGVFASYIGGHTQNPGAIPTSGMYIVNPAYLLLLPLQSQSS